MDFEYTKEEIMKGRMTMSNKSSLTFSFHGGYEVDAQAVAQTISSLVNLSSVIADREYPDAEFRLNVKAVRRGSLQFEFVAVANVIQTLFSPDVVGYTSGLITIMTAAFGIKKFLRGKRPTHKEISEDTIKLTNGENHTASFPKAAGIYFLDNRVDQSVTNIILAAKDCPDVTGISIGQKHDDSVVITRDEFSDCSQEIPAEEMEMETKTFTRTNETLYVRQADFTGAMKWRFSSDQNFSAAVLDKSFQEKLRTGKITISAKTYLIADVKVKMLLDQDGLPDTTKPVYEVIAVHSIGEVGKEPGQTSFL